MILTVAIHPVLLQAEADKGVHRHQPPWGVRAMHRIASARRSDGCHAGNSRRRFTKQQEGAENGDFTEIYWDFMEL